MENHAEPRPIDQPLASRSRSPFAISSGISGLAAESPVEIEINGVPVANLICTPESIEELVVGWSYSQGYLESKADIDRFRIHSNRASLMLRRALPGGHQWREQLAAGFDSGIAGYEQSGTVGLPARDGFVLEARYLLALTAELGRRFNVNPGDEDLSHTCATDGSTLIVSTKDVGRHNALDKLIGWSVLSEVALSDFVVAVNGRVGASIVHKVSRARAKMLLCDQRPSAQAVKLAQSAGITLIGHAFDERRTIFTHPWRVDRSNL